MKIVPAAAGRLVTGAPEIAAVTGLSVRRVYHEAKIGRMPTFRIGRSICAREGTLRAWMADQEDRAAHMAALAATPGGAKSASGLQLAAEAAR